MSDLMVSVVAAIIAMSAITCVSLVPVANLRRLAEYFGWVDKPSPQDVQVSSAALGKAAAAAKIMDFYMHDVESRKITKLIAAHNNLNPLSFEDVMTQVLLVRRDLGRIRKLVSVRPQEGGATASKVAPANLRDFGSVVYETIAAPRSSAVEVSHFTQVAAVVELHRAGAVRIGARRKAPAFASQAADREADE